MKRQRSRIKVKVEGTGMGREVTKEKRGTFLLPAQEKEGKKVGNFMDRSEFRKVSYFVR